MNFADIEKTWRSPHNRPSPAELEKDKMKLIADLKRHRRGFVFFMAPAFVVLSALTLRVGIHLVWPDPSMDRIDLTREWGFLLGLGLPWSALIYFVRQHLRHRAQHADYEGSISKSLRALLDENRLARIRVKIAAIMHGVFLLIMPLIVYQLRETGKAGDEILVPAFVIWPLIAAGIGIALWFQHQRRLLPERDRLQQLLNSYE